MPTVKDNGHCFVCGEHNPLGLKIDFHPAADGQGTEARVVFPDHFQGWEKVVHGGLLATVLDEMLIKAVAAHGFTCVTAEITVKYLRPAQPGAPYTLKGEFLQERGPLVFAQSRLVDPAGVEVARASGKLFKV